jgi:hypothetical protein
MRYTINISGLAWDEISGSQAGQDAELGRHAPEAYEDPALVRAYRDKVRNRAGRGYTYLVSFDDPGVADSIMACAEALAIGCRENEEYEAARALRMVVGRCQRVLEAARYDGLY